MRKHATVWRVAELLLGQPVITVTALAQRLQVSFPVANTVVGTLMAVDILRPGNKKRSRREFQAHEIMNILYAGVHSVLRDVATLLDHGPPPRAPATKK